MKVESIQIQNFKCFDHLELSFKNRILDEVSDRYLILGDNGTGKTTLLQAIALPLALATGRIREIADENFFRSILVDRRINSNLACLIERIVNRLERLDQVWEWLPEWKKLRQLIEETYFEA